MKKRKILNIMMVVAIAVIFISGIMVAGNLKGWFGNGSSAQVTVEEKSGGANIERSSVAYALEEGATLRDKDIIQTLNGASVTISYGENQVSFNENSEAQFQISEDGEVIIDLKSGEAFFITNEPAKLYVKDTGVAVEESVFSISAQYGSTNLSVFSNELTVDGEKVKEGQMASILADGLHTEELTIQSLNAFHLQKVRETLAQKTLCFTENELDALEAEREKAAEEALEAKLLEEQETEEIEEQREKNKESMQGDGSTTSGTTASGSSSASAGSGSGSSKNTCTITIRCDMILNNMDSLASGKNKYVPSNGVILATSKVSFNEGDTVFDVLKKACSLAGIQLEYSWTPMYNSYYIEGINHLYEFDCGNQSGWMYKVNGWFPNYGCSSYEVERGDSIVWCYTCKGLGADVGGSNR